MADTDPAGRAEAIAGYKSLLRACVERRPSGLRGRLALALGKHRSFVSQITNPAYRVPIPVADLPTIFEICHLGPADRRRFVALYRAAHPERAGQLPDEGAAHPPREVRVALPAFRSEATAREVEGLLLDVAARIVRLAQRAEGGRDDEEVRQPGRGDPG